MQQVDGQSTMNDDSQISRDEIANAAFHTRQNAAAPINY
jgi:hypothetical protein